MTTIFLAIGLVLAIALIAFLLFSSRKPNSDFLLMKQQMDFLRDNVDSSSKLVHQQMSQLTKELADRLQDGVKFSQESQKHVMTFVQESHKQVGDRLDNAARVVGDVQKSLGRVEEQTKKIFEVGKDISHLNEVLRSPKLRGSLGELFLTDLLSQVLPREHYETQYAFKSGQKVDAIIRSAQGLVSIDSKFPLENFVRIIQLPDEEEKKAARKMFLQDVKKHIDAIAQKYIVPDEGTLNFALMYVPAENVYYEIILRHEATERDLLQYAQDKKVFPVSPNSFYAYLQTIMIGFKGLQIQDGIRVVLDNIARLKGDFGKFSEDFGLVGRHLSNAKNSFDGAEKKFQKLGDKLHALEIEDGIGKQELRILKSGE